MPAEGHSETGLKEADPWKLTRQFKIYMLIYKANYSQDVLGKKPYESKKTYSSTKFDLL